MEIEPLVDKALAVRVDDDAERVAVLLETVADIEVADRRGVQIPLHRVAARPVPGRRGADIERHLEALAGVVFGAAHLGQIPVGAEIAGAHLGIGLEPAAGEDHRLRPQIHLPAPMAHPHAGDAVIALQQGEGGRFVQHLDPSRARRPCSAFISSLPPPQIWQASPPQNLNLPSTLNA